MGAFAWVTLATNDSYSLGALVLAHSLKQAGTVHQLAVLVTPGVTSAMRDKLASVFNVVQEVNILDSRDEANLRLLKRPELGITFTKLHCWRLVQFEKCVFLDADTLVLQNSDELFEREELSAAPDVGWPDCFNSGVFVYRPSLDTFEKLIQFALEKGSFDGGDQGLLNLYFSDWAHKDISKHLPFIYNMCSTACYSYLPAFKQFGGNAKIIHFIGAQKPWLQYFNTETKKVQPSGDSSHLQEVLQRWWDIFCALIHPHLSPAMQGQSTHGTSPSYISPRYDPPPYPIASADDFENAWDPWDEYDQKIAQNSQYVQLHNQNQNQLIESLNTNAIRVADQPTIYSQPQAHNNDNYTSQKNFDPPLPSELVYFHSTKVLTPPSSPQPQHHFEPPQFYCNQPEPPQKYFQASSSEPQYQQQTIEYYHFEKCPEVEHNKPSFDNSDPPQHTHYTETQPFEENVSYQPHFTHKHNDSHQSSDSASHKHNQEICFRIPDPPRSPVPNDPNYVPILANESEATRATFTDRFLNNTIEDSGGQEDAGLAGAFSQLTLGVARTPEQDALENVLRKQAWEVGNIDYLGKDSFENIWSKITETLSAAPAPVQVPVTEPEIPAAPAQSQTALQEEAPSVQPPVTPTETPADNVLPEKVSTVDSSESNLKEITETPKESVTTPSAVTETSKVAEQIIEPQTGEVQAPLCPLSLQQEVKQDSPALEQAVEQTGSLPEQLAVVPEPASPIPVPEPAPPVPAPEQVTLVAAPEQATPALAPEQAEVVPAQTEVVPAQTEIAPAQTEAVPAQTEAVPAQTEVVPTSEQSIITPVPLDAAKETQPIPVPESPQVSLKAETKVPPTEPIEQLPQVASPPVTEESPATVLPSVEKSVAEVPASGVTIESATPLPVEKSAETLVAPAESAEPAPMTTPVPTGPIDATSPTPSAPATPPVLATPPAEPSAPKPSPKTEVVEATPPTTPGTPTVPATASAVDKQSLVAEAAVPDTPPPSEGSSTPTPPPRKVDKPKKAAAKPKK